MDVVDAPAASEEEAEKTTSGEATPQTGKDKSESDAKVEIKITDKPKTPHDNGVTVAITITVVAILLLSGLAVFAYMSSTK